MDAVELLVEAGAALAGSLDPRTTMREVAKLTVPRLADICVIDLLDEQGQINDVAVVAADEEIARDLEELRARAPLDPDGEHPVARVIRSGQPELLAEMADTSLRTFAESSTHAEFMIAHNYRSAVVVPLRARGRTLGAISILRLEPSKPFGQAERPYGQEDLELALELARRAALAIDNARLFSDLRRLEQRLEAILIERRGGDHGDRSRRADDLRQPGRGRPVGVSHTRRADGRAPGDDHVSLSRLRRAGRRSSAWSRCPPGGCSRASIRSRCW